jgi:ABC-2 type transport system permease protein
MTTTAMTTTETTHTGRTHMTLWRLEVARLWRTHRWLIVVGVYAFFGAIGPVTARYFDAILDRFGGGVEVAATPDPTPGAAIGQFLGNASQLGLLAVVVVAAGALAVDARPEFAAFLRTRQSQQWRLLLPRYVVSTAVAAAALAAGTAIAWVLTWTLIGPPPAGPLLVGTLYGVLFLAFAVAVVAAVAGYTRSQATTVFAGLIVLLAFPIVSIIGTLAPWLPSELVGAAAAMVEGAPAGDYVRAALVTAVATVAVLAVALRRFSLREL